jgi:hypothetical protein
VAKRPPSTASGFFEKQPHAKEHAIDIVWILEGVSMVSGAVRRAGGGPSLY